MGQFLVDVLWMMVSWAFAIGIPLLAICGVLKGLKSRRAHAAKSRRDELMLAGAAGWGTLMLITWLGWTPVLITWLVWLSGIVSGIVAVGAGYIAVKNRKANPSGDAQSVVYEGRDNALKLAIACSVICVVSLVAGNANSSHRDVVEMQDEIANLEENEDLADDPSADSEATPNGLDKPPGVNAGWKLAVDQIFENLEHKDFQNLTASEMAFLIDVADFVAMDREIKRVEQLIAFANNSRERTDWLVDELLIARTIASAYHGTFSLPQINEISSPRARAEGLRRAAVVFAERGDNEKSEIAAEELRGLASATKSWRDQYAVYGSLGRLHGQLGQEGEVRNIRKEIGNLAKVAREAGSDREELLSLERESLSMLPLGLCEGSCFAAARGELAQYRSVGLILDGVYYEMATRQASALDFESAASSAQMISDDFLRANALQFLFQRAVRVQETLPQAAEGLSEIAMSEAKKVQQNPILFEQLRSDAIANGIGWGVNNSVDKYLSTASPQHRIPVFASLIKQTKPSDDSDERVSLVKEAIRACKSMQPVDVRRAGFEQVGQAMGEADIHPAVLEGETYDNRYQQSCGLLGVAKGRKQLSALDLVRWESGLNYVGKMAGNPRQNEKNQIWRSFHDALASSDEWSGEYIVSPSGHAIAIATPNGFDLASPATDDGVRGMQTFIESGNFDDSQKQTLRQLLFSLPNTAESRSGLQFTKRLAAHPEHWIIISVASR